MKKTILPLCVLLFSSLGFGQDLDPNAIVRGGPQVACADAPVSYRTVNAPNCNQAPTPGPGQHRLMRRDKGYGDKRNYKGYETGDYLLRHLPNGNLQAVINLDFKPWRDGTQAQANMMLARTRECMRKMAPYMKKGNQQLEVVVMTDDEVERLPRDQRPASREVRVSDESDDPTYRGNADEFGTNFDCITIGHELLHHLGLCDEYHETVEPTKTNWSCRPHTVAPSYMRDMWYAFNTTVPKTTQCECDDVCKGIMSNESKTKTMYLQMEAYEMVDQDFKRLYCTTTTVDWHRNIDVMDQKERAFIVRSEEANTFKFETRRPSTGSTVTIDEIQCTCADGISGDHCRRSARETIRRASLNLKRASCPTPYKPVGQFEIGKNGETGVEGNVLKIVSDGNSNGSLIAPAHFDKIMAGSCRNPNSTYEICASFAYINAASDECRQMPAQCNDDSFYLTNRPLPRPATATRTSR